MKKLVALTFVFTAFSIAALSERAWSEEANTSVSLGSGVTLDGTHSATTEVGIKHKMDDLIFKGQLASDPRDPSNWHLSGEVQRNLGPAKGLSEVDAVAGLYRDDNSVARGVSAFYGIGDESEDRQFVLALEAGGFDVPNRNRLGRINAPMVGVHFSAEKTLADDVSLEVSGRSLNNHSNGYSQIMFGVKKKVGENTSIGVRAINTSAEFKSDTTFGGYDFDTEDKIMVYLNSAL